MGWIPLYATAEDLDAVRQWLNAEPEIVWLVADGPERWIARPSVEVLTQPLTTLWHVPAGPLPLELTNGKLPVTFVDDPWRGWRERHAAANPSTPYFGVFFTGAIWFHVQPWSTRIDGALGLSSFEWIGNHYRVLGHAAHPRTERWWQRMRRWVAKRGVLVPRGGLSSTMAPEIWALPHARDALLAGARAAINPYG